MKKVISGMLGMLTVAALSAVLVSLSNKQASAETPTYTPTPGTPGFVLEPDTPGLVLEPDVPIDIPFPTPVPVTPTPVPAPVLTTVTLNLYVRETNASGALIVGASIKGWDATGTDFNVTTNLNGYATITGIAGTWHFEISKAGYQPVYGLQSIVTSHADTIYIIPIVSTPPPTPVPTTVTFYLYVHDTNDAGPNVIGASVTGTDANGSPFNQMTNSNGYATIVGVPGTWHFTISKTGYQSASSSLSVTTTSSKIAYIIPIQSTPVTPVTPVVPVPTALSWKILFLVYPNTDFSFMDGSISRRVVGSMTQANIDLIINRARRFVETDIPILNSGYMVPTVTVRVVQRTLTQLTTEQGMHWPSTAITAPELDSTFDSVIIIWQSHGIDINHNTSYQLEGNAAGLTTPKGTKQTYSAVPITSVSSNSTNVFKHEWGHGILFYFAATGKSPLPTVDNHITDPGSTYAKYVHYPTGQAYNLQDETETNLIPNSIYNNNQGFTHDYYSGITAATGNPTVPLGIPKSAWTSVKPTLT